MEWAAKSDSSWIRWVKGDSEGVLILDKKGYKE